MEETKQENLTGQYLTFDLADEQYAVDVAKVTSVLEMTQITKVPKTPEFMRGVINLRGSVVPVIDLRLKFGMSQTEQTQDTSIIVMEIELDGETVVIGALADSVHEVIEMDKNQIEDAPKFGTKLDTEFIKGIGKKDEGFLIILDIDKVFTSDEISAVSKKPMEKTE